jgi:sterol desaturase/sphingolipid hydroxylase (fatty acid hydroxylase superfamily)
MSVRLLPAMNLLSASEILRLAAFAAVLLGMALWEARTPRRQQKLARAARWPSNIGVVVLDTVLVRLIFPIGTIALALLAETRGWGAFNVLGVPAWVTVPAGVVLLDLAIYLQHVLFHAVPVLWRFHRMHHADLEFDVTTGVRFHPIEILLSMAIKLAVVLALGTPALAVLAFEILLNATSLFNHGNVALPARLDRALRWVMVTPDMHRVHHSIIARETNSNYGFNLSWWDRLFGTYRAQPEAGHLAMTIGIEQFRNPREQRLDHMLTQPFRAGVEDYAGRREAPN